MKENKERKCNLVTIRMDDYGKETLDYLSDRMDRSKSDTILRACKFFSGIGSNHANNVGDSTERGRKSNYIHMRVTDSDMEFLNNGSREVGRTISNYVRDAIKAYYDSINGIY